MWTHISIGLIPMFRRFRSMPEMALVFFGVIYVIWIVWTIFVMNNAILARTGGGSTHLALLPISLGDKLLLFHGTHDGNREAECGLSVTMRTK